MGLSRPELQRLLEIEGDDRGSRVFEQEVAQRGYGDLTRDLFACRGSGRCGAIDFFQRVGFEAVDQSVGFDAESLAAWSDSAAARRLPDQPTPNSLAAAGVSVTHKPVGAAGYALVVIDHHHAFFDVGLRVGLADVNDVQKRRAGAEGR